MISRMIIFLKKLIRQLQFYVVLREIMREGIVNFFKRKSIQSKILKTNPIKTDREGSTEVRVLCWRRDYINLIWALKSFYIKSKVNYPLYIHDGGLNEKATKALLFHFPNAHIINKEYADKKVHQYFSENQMPRSKEYRQTNIATLKLFDFFILSSAKRIISIDSDIVFFQFPDELLKHDNNVNRYNRDFQFAYSLSLEEIKENFNIDIISNVNSGLFNVSREIFNPQKLEEWLQNEKLFSNKWVTEQTLHALLAHTHTSGIAHLSSQYMVSTTRGIHEDAICKHYPGYFRPYFYQEGMRTLASQGFLKEFSK
jgi:hypothetical protein